MSTVDDSILKAGHPPAVKAGGMRITQHKNSERDSKFTKDTEELKISTSPSKAIIISGVQVKGHADFPQDAVQHYHEKSIPTNVRPAHHARSSIIQQPRK